MRKSTTRTKYEAFLLLLQTVLFIFLLFLLIIGCFKPGIWSEDETFYTKHLQGNCAIYYDKKSHLTTRIMDCTGGKEIEFEKDNQKAKWSAALSKNGTYQNISIVDENNNSKWIGSYVPELDSLTGNMPHSENELYENLISVPLSNNTSVDMDILALSKMLLEHSGSKTSGISEKVVISLLILFSGMLIIFFKSYIIKLDQFLLGFFYENSTTLKPTPLLEIPILFFGIFLYILGAANIVMLMLS